jgi:ribokinase
MRKILDFGSLNIDHVYEVEHFVQPGETEAALRADLLPGGKGMNQAAALARAGADVWMAGKVGRDGGWLAEMLGNFGVHTEYIGRSEGLTGTAFIQVAGGGQNSILIDRGANGEITPEFADSVLSGFGGGDILLLQNEISSLSHIIRRASERGMTVALNPSPINGQVTSAPLELVQCFILNEIEGKCLTGETKPEKILDVMLERYPQAKVVLTLGQDGAIYRDSGKTISHGIYRVPVADTTGAGDTFAGYFLACTAGGETPEEALRLASVASAIEITRKGAAAAVPSMEEVRAAKLELRPRA